MYCDVTVHISSFWHRDLESMSMLYYIEHIHCFSYVFNKFDLDILASLDILFLQQDIVKHSIWKQIFAKLVGTPESNTVAISFERLTQLLWKLFPCAYTKILLLGYLGAYGWWQLIKQQYLEDWWFICANMFCGVPLFSAFHSSNIQIVHSFFALLFYIHSIMLI